MSCRSRTLSMTTTTVISSWVLRRLRPTGIAARSVSVTLRSSACPTHIRNGLGFHYHDCVEIQRGDYTYITYMNHSLP